MAQVVAILDVKMEQIYGKYPKISNTLKFWTPNIFAQNNFWKCPKISNSSSFAKSGVLKFRTQLSSSIFLLAHSNFGNVFFFFSVTEPETKVVVLKATAKRKCTQLCHNEFYVHKWNGNHILILYKPRRYWLKIHKKKKKILEAHRPRVAHLSDTATADMQMLCDIFSILSSQLMKRSSFKQFLILKKNIYGMIVNDRHDRFPIQTI